MSNVKNLVLNIIKKSSRPLPFVSIIRRVEQEQPNAKLATIYDSTNELLNENQVHLDKEGLLHETR